jgi:hypothetical protein
VPTDDAVLDLGVPRHELLGWTVLVLLVASGGLGALVTGRGAVAVGCLVFVAAVVALVGPAVVGRVVAYPAGHLTIRSPLGTARWEMEDVEDVVVAPAARSEGSSIPPPLWGIELVTTSGVDVPLPSTRVLPLPALRRRLDRQAAALRAWLDAGPA